MRQWRSFEDQAFIPFIMYYYVIQGGCESWNTLRLRRGHLTFLESRRFLLQVYKRAAMHSLWNLGVGHSTRLKPLSRRVACLFVSTDGGEDTKPLITAMYITLRAQMLPGIAIFTAHTDMVVTLRHTEALGCRATLTDPSVWLRAI